MNKVILIGNLGADPEPVSNGTIAKVSLATSEKYTKKGETEPTTETTWHTVFFYGKTAEVILKYFKKGQKMAVTGSYKTSKYKNEKTGQDVFGYFVRGDEFEFVEKSQNAPASSQNESATSTSTPAPTTSQANTSTPAKPAAKKPLAATVAAPVHTEADLSSYDDSDPTANDDLPF